MGTIIDLSRSACEPPSPEEAFSRANADIEVIRLQNYDNFYSLMDRLCQRDASGEPGRRLVLVFPPRGRILSDPMDYGRLRFWASQNGYEIAFVIPGSDSLRKMAAEHGFRAFRSLNEADEAEWVPQTADVRIDDPAERIRRLAVLKKEAEQSQESPMHWFPRLLIFLLTIGILAFVFIMILPQAKVEIVPLLSRETLSMSIWTDDRLETVTIDGGIPTTEKQLELTLSAVVPATGSVQVEPSLAVGTVVLENTCPSLYSVSSGTLIGTTEELSEGITFRMLSAVQLEPEAEQEVRVEAVSGGADGNLPAGSLRFIAYPDARCIAVRQETDFSSGNDGIYASPRQADLTAAREKILSLVPESVEAALRGDPDHDDLLLLGDPSEPEVRSEHYSPEPGFSSPTLEMRQTLRVRVKTVRRSDMETLIRNQTGRMNGQTSALTGYRILSGPENVNGLSVWAVEAEFLNYEPETNAEALQMTLRGKTLEEAQAILATLRHVKQAKITLLPSRMNRLPLAAQNIRVIIYPAVEVETP